MSPTTTPFHAFLGEHRRAVLAFLRASVGPDDAEDCFQETFIAALRAYRRLDGANPRAWVLTIARHKAIDHARARARRPQPRAELPQSEAASGSVAGDGQVADPEALWSAVAGLPAKQREAITLRFAADLRYREIAAAMACTEEAARRSVHEGLKRLRARMPNPEGGPSESRTSQEE